MRPFLASILIPTTMSLAAQDIKPVAYADGPQTLSGQLTGNTGPDRPGVLILPAWMGIDDEARTAASELAKQGYIVFIADIYGEGHVPSNATEARTIATRYKTDFAAYQHRIALALEQLKKAGADPDRIAVIGYCFGGTGALEAARAQLPVRGVVSIHGGLGKGDRPNGPISTSVLIQHPEADATVTPEHLAGISAELNAAKVDWQLISYAHCGHTFTNPASKDYNERMAKRAWQHLLLFLREVIG